MNFVPKEYWYHHHHHHQNLQAVANPHPHHLQRSLKESSPCYSHLLSSGSTASHPSTSSSSSSYADNRPFYIQDLPPTPPPRGFHRMLLSRLSSSPASRLEESGALYGGSNASLTHSSLISGENRLSACFPASAAAAAVVASAVSYRGIVNEGDKQNSQEQLLCQLLQDLQLDPYFVCFRQAGYSDDLWLISRMTPEDLTGIGVTHPRHRKIIKAAIAQLNWPDNLPSSWPGSLMKWLQLLNLVEYHETLLSQDFKEVENLLKLSWEDLEEIGIVKLGHQKKILLAVDRLRRIRKGSQSPSLSRSSAIPPLSSLLQGLDASTAAQGFGLQTNNVPNVFPRIPNKSSSPLPPSLPHHHTHTQSPSPHWFPNNAAGNWPDMTRSQAIASSSTVYQRSLSRSRNIYDTPEGSDAAASPCKGLPYLTSFNYITGRPMSYNPPLSHRTSPLFADEVGHDGSWSHHLPYSLSPQIPLRRGSLMQLSVEGSNSTEKAVETTLQIKLQSQAAARIPLPNLDADSSSSNEAVCDIVDGETFNSSGHDDLNSAKADDLK